MTGGMTGGSSVAEDVTRFLLFSDLQLDRAYPWAPLAVAAARRAAARDALVALLAEVRRRSVDAIVCAGDLFNRNTVQPSTIQWVMAAFRAAEVPILIAPGNEDWIGPLGRYTRHHWPSNVTIFKNPQLTPVEITKGVTVWGAAHCQAHSLASFFDGFRVNRLGVNLALFHGTETAAEGREPYLDPSASFAEGEVERTGLDHAFVGHCQLPHFGRLHTYPGSPLAHDFGPSVTRGAVFVEVGPDGLIERELIPIPSPGLHEVMVDVTGARSAYDVARRTRSAIGDLKGTVRLRLQGRISPDIVVRHDDLEPDNDAVDQTMVTWEAGVDLDLEALTNEPTVRGQFVRDALNSPTPANERLERILLIGLRALAGHDELGAMQ